MLSLLLLLACGDKDTSTAEDTASVESSEIPDTPPVWYGDIQSLIANNCSTCHIEGGAAPFVFEQFEDVEPLAPVMLNSMQSGSMPPWLPNPDCIEYKDERLLKDWEIERFGQWIDDGFPMGDPALGESAVPLVEDIVPTHSAQMPAGFIPDTNGGADQYRCFVMDLEFEEETFITQTQVLPGSPQVHHVLMYALAPEMSEAVRNADGEDGTVGYPCFGDPFPRGGGSYDYGFPTQIGAWVPGIEPSIFPEKTALRVAPGSTVVMQVHYSALGGEPIEDSTTYNFVTTDETPSFIASTRPLAIQDLDIPAGATNVTASDSFTNYYDRPIELASGATHMHLLGKSQLATIVREDGTTECLLDIPDWDFAWQQSYEPIDTVTIAPGERVDVTCAYDNSQANQPIVDGEQIEPSDVEWGDGTLDEMCLLYTTTIDPYKPLPPQGAAPCYGVEECIEDCGESLACVMSCESVEFECLTCSLDVFLDCGLSTCAISAIQAEGCLRECFAKSIMMGSPIGSCFEYECPNEYEALVECADPVLQGETCATQLLDCGIDLAD